MTPIPPDVAAAIVAAGHSLSAEPLPSVGYGRAQWEWHSGAAIAPRWSVSVGGRKGRAPTARAAVLASLARVAAEADVCERKARAEAARLRRDWKVKDATDTAETAAKRAAAVRTLAAQVAAMWPEVTP